MEGWSVSKTGTIYKKKNWIGKATDHASWMKLWKMYVKGNIPTQVLKESIAMQFISETQKGKSGKPFMDPRVFAQRYQIRDDDARWTPSARKRIILYASDDDNLPLDILWQREKPKNFKKNFLGIF